MKLVVISHKQVWESAESPTGYATVGGFPFQMKYLSRIFDETTLIVPVRRTPMPQAAYPLTGHNMQVLPLSEPIGQDLRRKIAMLTWLPRNVRTLWRAIQSADVIHAPIPGDLGLIGIFLSVIQQKRLFVRHCGNWLKPSTTVDRFAHRLLEKIAGKRAIVFATGGGKQMPSPENPAISWIFSTSLTEEQWQTLPQAPSWHSNQTLNLITVGRLSSGKNIQITLAALAEMVLHHDNVRFHIVGDGAHRSALEAQVAQLGLQKHVVFHGSVSHQSVLALLASAHLFVFPSASEGFPKAVLEAMACRLPAIVSPVSVLPQLIGTEAGIVLSSADADEVREAIMRLIADPSLRNQLADGARRISQTYTLEAWQDEITKRLVEEWGGPLREMRDET